MGSRFTRRATLASLIGAIAVAGCGASGGGSGGNSKAASVPAPATAGHPQYITQADAICQQTRKSLTQFVTDTRALGTLGETPKAFALAATVARRLQSLERGELARLQALRLPSGDNSNVTAYFRQETAILGILGRLADAFVKGDKPGIASAERDASQMAAAAKGLAQGYGFKVCGNGAGGTGLS